MVMGAVATSEPELAARLRFLQKSIGAVPSPFDCYLALRGMKTLHVRMEAGARNAQRVAEMLEAHPLVDKVACVVGSGAGGLVAREQAAPRRGGIRFVVPREQRCCCGGSVHEA